LALAGFVRVSLNARATPSQQREVLADSGARALVHAAESAAAVPAATAGLDHLTTLLELGDGYERALAGASAAPPGADPDPEDLYCLFYTSGTTGRPKGVMLTHRAYHAVAINLLLEFGPVAPGEKILLPQPMSHGAGFFLPAWFASGGVAVAMERFEPDA